MLTVMNNQLTRPLAVLAALGCSLAAADLTHATVNILALGDSITEGVGSTDSNGYRGPLQALLNGTTTDYDFVGPLHNGVGIDPDHYGIPGITAYQWGNTNNLRDQLLINNVFPDLYDAGQGPDKVLLHIQTNAFNGGGGGDPAGIALQWLLRGLTVTDPGSTHYIGATGDHDIVLAYILPKGGNPDVPNTDGGLYSDLSQHQARVKSSFDFNYGGGSNTQWANGIDSIIASRPEFAGRISTVDMFRIDVDSLNLSYLLDQFGTSLGITTTQEMRDIISPDDDTLDGNPFDAVDWVLNYDEFNNTFGDGVDGVNTALHYDPIHPNDLGYAIMAQVWFTQGLGMLFGDINGDGFVGLDDLSPILSNWNQNVTPGDQTHGDLTNDGYVGLDDLEVILSNWNAGTLPPPPAEALALVTPEPASLSIMLLMGAATLRRRVR